MGLTRKEYEIVQEINTSKARLKKLRKQQKVDLLKKSREGREIFTNRGQVLFDDNYYKQIDEPRFIFSFSISTIIGFIVFMSMARQISRVIPTTGLAVIMSFAIILAIAIIPTLVLHRFTYFLTKCE